MPSILHAWNPLLAITASLLVLACDGAESIRPDLVLITVAPLPAEVLACYGGRSEAGAEICGLGETGARYAWAFAPALDVAPATASLLTSSYPWQHGVTESAATFLRSHLRSVAEVMRSAGYTTAAFVAAPSLNRSRNLQQGFDLFDDRSAQDAAIRGRGVAERALAWADEARSPFLLWIHFEAESGLGQSGADPDETALRRLDRRLSQLIAVLDADSHEPGILLAGVQGQVPAATASRDERSGYIHPDRVRVPLLWRPPRAGPGLSVGRRVTTPVSLIDVAPTLLQAAGLPVPEEYAGRPLPYGELRTTQPDGEGAPTVRPIYIEHSRELAVVANGEWGVMERSALHGPDGPQLGEDESGRGRTAGLWPEGNRRGEGMPAYDDATLRRDRMHRLRPWLEDFAALVTVPSAEPISP